MLSINIFLGLSDGKTFCFFVFLYPQKRCLSINNEKDSVSGFSSPCHAAGFSPVAYRAQWRIGVNVGGMYNHYVIDKHYFDDYQYKDRWGVGFGLMGQYDILDWLGVRAELDYVQKNHQVQRTLDELDCRITNSYLQLPVMASFSFGGTKLRGFCHVGAYGGYWLNSRIKGVAINHLIFESYDIDEDIPFDSERDQRWDFGFLGGLGMEYRFASHWAAQVEMRYYHSVVSTQKDYMRVKDPKYNSTLALQAGVCYFF